MSIGLIHMLVCKKHSKPILNRTQNSPFWVLIRYLLGFAHPGMGSPFQVHERITLLRGREYEECPIVALNTMFVKYIGTIYFDIFWFEKELYIKFLYNNIGSCIFARKI